ncbi:2OG-Fe(II) oxygenase [Streptomyces sp. NPDC050161]|uniref:2OG-Fe(II) oxygenase n=1 Tax=Streptomyces sp. NPDC050161 TaxID=3365604 RepID=UPI00379A3C4F
MDTINMGFNRVRRSMRKWEWKTAQLSPADDELWTPQYVSCARDNAVKRLTMRDFGYTSVAKHNAPPSEETIAYSGAHQVLTAEGIAAFRRVCEKLADRAPNDDYIVSKRVRNVMSLSRFIRDMAGDPQFLGRLSAIAGAPLVPHPLVSPAICVNYFDNRRIELKSRQESQVARWHYDGMTYVFVMQLTDSSEFEGGDLMIHQGGRQEFERNQAQVTAQELDHPKVFRAPFSRPGDTVYTRGSALWHAVRPVTSGRRISVVLSLFSPMHPADANTFWHVAAEDGLLDTLSSFSQLRRAQYDTLGYCRRNDIDLMRVFSEAAGFRELVAPR